MPRPPLDIGTSGKVRTYWRGPDGKWHAPPDEDRAAQQWRAITQYRGADGKTRPVERTGTTEAKAKRTLAKAIAEMSGADNDSDITGSTRFREAARVWLKQTKSRVSPRSFESYTDDLDVHILPRIGDLLLRECRAGRLQRLEDDLAAVGLAPATRRKIRTPLSGVMQLAVLNDVFEHNPAKELRMITGSPSGARAMTLEQLSAFLIALDADDKATASDLPDLVRFLFGTGVRISEALAVRWSDVNFGDTDIVIDDDWTVPPGAAFISGRIVYVNKQGLLRVEDDSGSKRTRRVIMLPTFLYTLLSVRKPVDAEPGEPLFPSRRNLGYRNPKSVHNSVKLMRERIGWPQFTTHVGRKTVATLLHDAKHADRKVADQLGHSRISTTQNYYFGRALAVDPAAAALIDAAHRRDQSPT